MQMAVQPRADRVRDLLRGRREHVVLVEVGDAVHDARRHEHDGGRGEDVGGRVPEDEEAAGQKAAGGPVEENLVEDDLQRPRFDDA